MGLIKQIAAAIAVAISLLLGGRWLGQRTVTKDLTINDLREAREVKILLEDALEKARTDPRPVDERLRSKGRLRD